MKEKGIIADLVYMNGDVAFQFYMCHNHLGSNFDHFMTKIKELVTKEGKEVFGMIYFHNDEDFEFHDSWQVWLVRIGELTKVKDSFLSPLSEKIEIYD